MQLRFFKYMTNTLLYCNSDRDTYSFFRLWDGGNGYATGTVPTLDMMGDYLKSWVRHFEKPFKFAGGIPNIDWKKLDPRSLRPLTETEINKVVEALGKL